VEAKAALVFGGWFFTFGAVLSGACAPAAPAPAAPAASASAAPTASAAVLTTPADAPIASLRTGGLPPIEHLGSAHAAVVARFADDRFETLAVDVVLPLSGAFDWAERVGARVSLDSDVASPYAFAAIPEDVSAIEGRGLGAATLWVRRSRQQEGKPLRGVIYTPQLGADPGHKVSFSADSDPQAKSDPKVLGRWASAFATHLREIGSGPWNQFAAARVEEVWGPAKKKPREASPRPSRDDGDLSRLMETTTGLLSVQEALQHDRPLLLAASKDKRAVSIGKLSPPKLTAHPWDELLRTVPVPPPEPLAAAVPAEFWYLRASDLASLLASIDDLDAWGTPAANLLDRRIEERDLAARYETQLGILRTGLAKALGPEVVEIVALTGSDPYLREGSDLTAVFKVRHPKLFDAGLDAMLAVHAKAHGAPPTTTVVYGETRIAVTVSPDGALRQHRASVGDLTVVSNSLAATRRVLDAIQGKTARLADEKDFRYLLARDQDQHLPLLLFLGDRFVAEVVGPRQKILEARRQIAAAELMTPGFAALLYGWVFGKSPATLDELLSSKLLRKEELKHVNDAPIEWRPGKPAQSSWGTPSSLAPLVELPPPDTVSESERAAYDHFSRTYQTYWSRYVDPTALRLAPRLDSTSEITADLRVMPLIDGSDYRELVEMAGDARVSTSPLEAGVRAIVGIGATAKVRRELASIASAALGRHAFQLDFLGDWAMAGIADRTRLASVVKRLRVDLPEAPESEPIQRIDEIAEAARIPAYAAVEIRSPAGAALALAAIRKMADETLHGMLTWGDIGTEHGTTLFRVAVGQPRENASDDRTEPEIFYALTDKAFLASLDQEVLRSLVADQAEGRGPVAENGRPKTDAAQFVFDLKARCAGGLATVLGWLLSEQVVRASRNGRTEAEALLRGAPELARDGTAMRALSLAYFGAVSTPPHGGSYTLGADGVRDPVLGSASSPSWPPLPVAGSTVDRVLATLGGFHSEVAFDPEGGAAPSARAMRSLHVRAAFGFCRP
jgi:hypothetical protein